MMKRFKYSYFKVVDIYYENKTKGHLSWIITQFLRKYYDIIYAFITD